MKVLITGSNGLLGQHLVKLLKSYPFFQVIATSRGENRQQDKSGYEYLPLDIDAEAEVKKVIADTAPEVIIHAAAMTNVDDCETNKGKCWQLNVEATRYLINAAREVNAFFMLLSTDFIFNGEDGPYDERALPDPLSYYGSSKLVAEMMLQASGLHWAIIRTVLVYGIAGDLSRSNIILWVKKKLEAGERIRVVHDQWRTPTLVQDLAMGCKLIAEKKAAGIYNIAGKDFLTPYEMAIRTAGFFSLDDSLIEKADASTFTQTARRPARTGLNIEKARTILGYEPHSFEEGIAIMADEMRSYESNT